MMTELRRLKLVLGRLDMRLKAYLVPSVVKNFSNRSSRRFPYGYLQIRKKLRRSIADLMEAPRDAFTLHPLCEHPRYLLRAVFDELHKYWSKEEVRLLFPPVELIGATVFKLAASGSAGILLIPNCPRQSWHQAALKIASKVERLPHDPVEL